MKNASYQKIMDAWRKQHIQFQLLLTGGLGLKGILAGRGFGLKRFGSEEGLGLEGCYWLTRV